MYEGEDDDDDDVDDVKQVGVEGEFCRRQVKDVINSSSMTIFLSI